MNYNDYPILTNQEYETISNNFNFSKPERKTVCTNLYQELASTLDICSNILNKYNHTITNQLKSLQISISNIIENLKANFTFSSFQFSSYSNSNIFKLIIKIQNCLKLSHNWCLTEEKDYYKNMAKTIYNKVFELNYNLISAIEKSNVKLFKHM